MGSHHYFTFINQLIILINDWLTVKRMVFFFPLKSFTKHKVLLPSVKKRRSKDSSFTAINDKAKL